MNSLQLYLTYLATSLRSQMQYRASFLMQTIGHGAITVIEFFGIWALFQRIETLDGWSLPEVAVFYGFVNLSFAIADALGRGFDLFGNMVKSGDFDRLLVRPRSTVLQLAGQELTLKRIGRFLQAAVILSWGSSTLGITWTVGKVLLATSIVGGSVCLFFGLVVLQATLAFWTTETLEIMNSFTYGGVYAAQYPLSIYRSWLRKFFLYVIPLGAVSYYPVLAILEKADPLGSSALWQWIAPSLGAVFLLIALRLWEFGVRHYCSTGS